MIKLILSNKFKSLEPLQIELPDLVVLTGLNGAGKTQLVTAFKQVVKKVCPRTLGFIALALMAAEFTYCMTR